MNTDETQDHVLAFLEGTSGRTTRQIWGAFPISMESAVTDAIAVLGATKKIRRLGNNGRGETIWAFVTNAEGGLV